MSAVDFFSNCFGCGKEFRPGDERLRFTLAEFSAFEGLDTFDGEGDIDIGLCAACTKRGNFKTPEVVAAVVIPEEEKQ